MTNPDNFPHLIDATPALDVCRWVLRLPDLPPEISDAAIATLAQSPEWTDVALAREWRTAFWSTPASEHGDNFNRRRDIEAAMPRGFIARLLGGRWHS